MSKKPFPSFPRLTIFAGAVDRCRCISSMPAVSFPLTVLALDETFDGTWLTESSGVTLLIIPARSDGWSDGCSEPPSDGFSEPFSDRCDRICDRICDRTWDLFCERICERICELTRESPSSVGACDCWRVIEGLVSKEDRRDSMEPPLLRGGFMEDFTDCLDNSWLTIEGLTFPLLSEA